MKVNVEEFKQYLASLDIDSEILPTTDMATIDQLDIPIGVDDQDRERRIIVMVDREEPEEDELEEEDAVHLVKFLGVMPVPVKEELLGETARMVSFINHVADVPGFLLTEPLSSVHFLYTLPCPGGQVEPIQFVASIGLVGSMVDLYQSQIEKVSTGEVTFDKILAGEVEIEDDFDDDDSEYDDDTTEDN